MEGNEYTFVTLDSDEYYDLSEAVIIDVEDNNSLSEAVVINEPDTATDFITLDESIVLLSDDDMLDISSFDMDSDGLDITLCL